MAAVSLIIDEKVDREMADKFSEFFNAVPPQEEKVIYFSTTGGDLKYRDIIIDLINRNSENLTLVAVDYIASAGFTIFIEAKCKKELTKLTEGMFHMSQVSVNLDENFSVSTSGYEARQFSNSVDLRKEVTMKTIKDLKFTKKEKKRALSGKDVVFSYERMLEFIADDKTQ